MTTDTPTRTASAVDYSQKWLVLIAVGMGTFLATIDGTIISVARPTLEQKLNTDFAAVQWVTLAYLLTVTVLLLSMGRLGDMVGKKRPYLFGVVLFGAGSVLCGLSPSIEWLIIFRILQAVGAAAQQALGTAIITEAFPPTERGRALGIGGLLVSGGILAGPVIGGFLLEAFNDWRPIFFVNVPIVLAAIFMVLRYVPSGGSRPGQKFDIPGAVTLGVSLTALMLALTFGQTWGWTAPQTLGLLGVFAIFFAFFLVIELRSAQPMVDLTLFLNPQFAISLTAAILVFITVSSREIIPWFLERGQGLDRRDIGILLGVWPLAMAATAPLAGWLSDRVGSMRISTVGLVVTALGYFLFTGALTIETTLLEFGLLLIPTGLGIGLFQSPNTSAVMGSVSKARLGLASSFLALSRNMGQTIGIAAVGALWATQALANLPDELVGTITDAAEAPPDAIAAATVETMFVMGILAVGVTLLGLAGIWVERQRRQQTQEQ